MDDATSRSVPVAPTDRIIALDVLRGIAILGILIMNIQAYSMIGAAYINPTAFGNLTGANKWVWIFSHIFADQKFMTIFAILYGAGIVLITTKAESKGLKAAGLHYRRTLWLLVIGLMHAYLLWYGDILVTYSLCALIAFLFRKISPPNLLIIGVLLISVSSALYFIFGLSLPQWPADAVQETVNGWKPNPELIDEEISAYQGGWLAQMTKRAPTAFGFQTFLFLIWAGWRAGGLMLVGMALFKWSVLTAERSRGFYLKLLAVGFGVGLPVVTLGVIRNFAAGWTFEYSMFFGWQFNYWGSLFVSLGYISAVMLLCKLLSESKFIGLFAGVGRTALTNYLVPTIICTTIFYGHGLGLFGQLERTQQTLVVLGVWALQLLATSFWLRRFRFGPAEWLWRSLTYLKMQPLRKS